MSRAEPRDFYLAFERARDALQVCIELKAVVPSRRCKKRSDRLTELLRRLHWLRCIDFRPIPEADRDVREDVVEALTTQVGVPRHSAIVQAFRDATTMAHSIWPDGIVLTNNGKLSEDDLQRGLDFLNSEGTRQSIRDVSLPEFDDASQRMQGELAAASQQAKNRAEGSAAKESPSAAAAGDVADEGSGKQWLRISEAETISAINRGTIYHAARNGEILTNGKTGHAKRLDAASFNQWQLRRAKKPEPQESDAAVKKKLARADED